MNDKISSIFIVFFDNKFRYMLDFLYDHNIFYCSGYQKSLLLVMKKNIFAPGKELSKLSFFQKSSMTENKTLHRRYPRVLVKDFYVTFSKNFFQNVDLRNICNFFSTTMFVQRDLYSSESSIFPCI